MREILFKGKTPSTDEYFDDGEWVQGFYTCFNGEEHRIYSGYAETDCGDYYPDWCNIRPETLGRYTGINVGNEKLFEGDIVECYEDYDDTWGHSHTAVGRGVVIWDAENFCWSFQTDDKYIQPFNDWSWDNSYIIGNVYDNPELLRTPQNDEVRE